MLSACSSYCVLQYAFVCVCWHPLAHVSAYTPACCFVLCCAAARGTCAVLHRTGAKLPDMCDLKLPEYKLLPVMPSVHMCKVACVCNLGLLPTGHDCQSMLFSCRSMYECVHASLTGTELVSTPFPAQLSDPAKKLQAAQPKAGGHQFRRWKW